MGDNGTARVLFVQHQDDCPPGHVGDRVRQRGAEVEVVRVRAARLPDPTNFDLIVPLGCYDSAYDESLPYLGREWDLLAVAVASDVPVFGICFGAQLLSRVLGGEVRPAPDGPEIGWIEIDTADTASGDTTSRTGDTVGPGPWLVWHLDVMTPPPDGRELAWSSVGTQAFSHGKHLGVQFHPEATVESALSWAEHHRDLLPAAGTSYDEITAATRRLAADAPRRAYELTDRVLDRALRRGGVP
ncbi:type 1 glutamine amidotransferase [Haloechinothrix salitolerans]|uniref:Type 1 glutamine amidotransferase n=1 Tax=Haloechinothrix salitolerans TaxID=926830 RepID=A0ABW2C0T6_9PSEU